MGHHSMNANQGGNMNMSDKETDEFVERVSELGEWLAKQEGISVELAIHGRKATGNQPEIKGILDWPIDIVNNQWTKLKTHKNGEYYIERP